MLASSLPRRAARYTMTLGAALAALLTAACADAPTAPAAARGPASLAYVAAPTPTNGTALGVARTTALPQAVSASATITRRSGGTLALPGTGLRVVVPANAIAEDQLTITVTAPAGRAVAYEFGPHGTRFSAPLTVEQDYRGLAVSGSTDLGALYVGYFATPEAFDAATGTATVSEEIPVRIDAKRSTASFQVWHFSGYMLSSGKTTTTTRK